MDCVKSLSRLGLILCLLAACSPAVTAPPTPTQPPPTNTPEPLDFPLSAPGPYGVDQRQVTFTDAARNDRIVKVTVWFPAVLPQGSTGGTIIPNAEPDFNEAPYPLILSSTKMAKSFAPHLVSHGFTWASVDGIDYYLSFYEGSLDQPLDIVFALDQVAAHPPANLEGMIDADHAGTTGYSFDGFNSLAVSGVRIDPEYYLSQCPDPDPATKAILGGLSSFSCSPARGWEAFTSHFSESVTATSDGLWQPLTDPRIRAVMPMAAEGWWLYGERGLAAVDRPVLMINGTQDELYAENVWIFDHITFTDKRLISFVGYDHNLIFDEEMAPRIAHFMTAFFGYYLQGQTDTTQYISEDFVTRFDDLAWGEVVP